MNDAADGNPLVATLDGMPVLDREKRARREKRERKGEEERVKSGRENTVPCCAHLAGQQSAEQGRLMFCASGDSSA
jgi:hypothetical protein